MTPEEYERRPEVKEALKLVRAHRRHLITSGWRSFKLRLMDLLEISRDQANAWDVPVEYQYAFKRVGRQPGERGWSKEDAFRQIVTPAIKAGRLDGRRRTHSFGVDVPFSEIDEESKADIINCIANSRYEVTGHEEDIVGMLEDAEINLVDVMVDELTAPSLPDEEAPSFMESKVAKYTRAMERGSDFPPVIVIGDELCEGHHRFLAAKRAGIPTLKAWDVASFVEVAD